MTDSIDFTNQLSPVTVLQADTPVASAKQVVADQQTAFLVIDSTNTRTFISAEQLADVSSSQIRTLDDLSEQLPPIVAIASTWSSLSTDQIDNLLQAIEATETSGVLVYRDREVLGILSAKTLADNMPAEVTRVSKGLDGTSTVPFRIYSCQTCGSVRVPAFGGSTPPSCPKDPSHGQMSLELS